MLVYKEGLKMTKEEISGLKIGDIIPVLDGILGVKHKKVTKIDSRVEIGDKVYARVWVESPLICGSNRFVYLVSK
jgi:hypothetical protein